MTYRKGDAWVDSKQFDELVARLASGQSRREALKGIAGGALATVGVTSVASSKTKKSRGRVGSEACIPTGKKCPSKKPRGPKGKKLGCNRCCQHFVDTSGPKNKCACIPNSLECEKDAYCCSGNCQGGTCQEYGAV